MLKRSIVACGVAFVVLVLSIGCGGHKGVMPVGSSELTSLVGPSRGGQAPATPTLYFPPNGSAYNTAGGYCLFVLRTTDPESDRVQYKVEVFQEGSLVATFDQTQNTSGWCTIQDFLKGVWGNRSDFASGEFAYLKANLPPGTYQWRASATDGTSWSQPSSLRTFIKR